MVAHWRYIEITFFIQGQAAGGVGLTCFVYISLLENQDLFTASDPVTVGLYKETNKGIKEKKIYAIIPMHRFSIWNQAHSKASCLKRFMIVVKQNKQAMCLPMFYFSQQAML